MRCVDLSESFPTNSNENLLAKFAFDTAENEPLQDCFKIARLAPKNASKITRQRRSGWSPACASGEAERRPSPTPDEEVSICLQNRLFRFLSRRSAFKNVRMVAVFADLLGSLFLF